MSGPVDEHVGEARRWLRYAREDLTSARILDGDASVPPRQVCWLAQQAIEKALKAALTLLRVEFSKTHNLDLLRNLLPGDWTAKTARPDLAELTAWAIEARYPGGWPEAMAEDARRALETATAVLDAITADLVQRGC